MRCNLDCTLYLSSLFHTLENLSYFISVEAMHLILLDLDSEFTIHRQILRNFSKPTLVARDIIEVDHARG